MYITTIYSNKIKERCTGGEYGPHSGSAKLKPATTVHALLLLSSQWEFSTINLPSKSWFIQFCYCIKLLIACSLDIFFSCFIFLTSNEIIYNYMHLTISNLCECHHLWHYKLIMVVIKKEKHHTCFLKLPSPKQMGKTRQYYELNY